MQDQPNLRLAFLQEYQLSDAQFGSLLRGEITIGCLCEEWAVRRLIENTAYDDIVRLLGMDLLVNNWPRWRKWIQSGSRRKGLDFFTTYLQEAHPDRFGEPDHGTNRV